jgi:hypothetical protein
LIGWTFGWEQGDDAQTGKDRLVGILPTTFSMISRTTLQRNSGVETAGPAIVTG